jgi:hypothetical protein
MPMIPPTGFCISLQRIRQEKRTTKAYPRTVGNYTCYWNGTVLAGLNGQIVERGGPGDNSATVGRSKHLRIREGAYPLSTHDGEGYRTSGYSSGRRKPKPGILLQDTGDRSAIIIHPGEDYLWSIGCLNPGFNLHDANSSVEFNDSRDRVIAIIEAMKAKMGARFPRRGDATIPDAIIVIQGEPT